ncbi:Werner Syndrome-like exonuclease isoform X3 [Osmia bicornis bicornis]|nr:Werner Syndrome-like exonuclease isoform X3 [Osmia bicornis bicornis]XP_029048315.1 Werner Syndrome-like exonuclease isoform X3 [Osmia bicornis bicornis]XP_029048316.1 Werner Syndrome-like exonuclease isoform X3 [Osmia bicornis bicornis]XP_029048317.1 Werner Syndrome-like exonuclease isoform X3 [Osmia bicornis bicornis]
MNALKTQSEKGRIIEKKLNMSVLPFILFKGCINYVSEFDTCAMICDNIIKEVENYDSDIVPVGFDLEWPFSFQTGSGKTALIQICLNNNICHLLHVYSLKKLPAALVILLSHPKVKLVGVNVKNDIWKLGRDFTEFPASKVVENNCIDCGTFANRVLNRSCRWSLEKLTVHLLNKSLDKNSKVRKSKWHIHPLNDNQKMYAATDAYVSWLLYITIQEKANLKEIEENVNCI